MPYRLYIGTVLTWPKVKGLEKGGEDRNIVGHSFQATTVWKCIENLDRFCKRAIYTTTRNV